MAFFFCLDGRSDSKRVFRFHSFCSSNNKDLKWCTYFTRVFKFVFVLTTVRVRVAGKTAKCWDRFCSSTTYRRPTTAGTCVPSATRTIKSCYSTPTSRNPVSVCHNFVGFSFSERPSPVEAVHTRELPRGPTFRPDLRRTVDG